MIEEYKRNGYILVKSFFSKEEVEQVRQDAKNVFIAQMKELGIIQSNNGSKVEFESAMTHYFNSKHLAKSEVYYKTLPHQNGRRMQGSLNSVMWVPLVDVDVELGALEIIPGSHVQGSQNSTQDEWFRKIGNGRCVILLIVRATTSRSRFAGRVIFDTMI